MQLLGSAIYHAFHILDVGIPYCIASSMRMAYVITEMNALTTNITLSHLDTSSTLSCFLYFIA